MKFFQVAFNGFLTGSILLLASSVAPAQEGEDLSVKFLSFPRIADTEPVQLLVGEDKTIEVQTPSHELSPAYKVKRVGTWTLVEPGVGEDGKPAFRVLGSAPALASSSQLVLLIRKGKSNSDGFDVIPIDNRIELFGGGKFLFVNAAQVDLGGVVGTERFNIRPGQHTIITPKPESPGSRVCHAAFFFPKDGEPKNFFSSKWPLSDGARGLIFFYHDPHTLRLRLHTIWDYL